MVKFVLSVMVSFSVFHTICRHALCSRAVYGSVNIEVDLSMADI